VQTSAERNQLCLEFMSAFFGGADKARERVIHFIKERGVDVDCVRDDDCYTTTMELMTSLLGSAAEVHKQMLYFVTGHVAFAHIDEIEADAKAADTA
jgi:hypothetical protein